MHAPPPDISEPLLRLDGLTKRFGAHTAVDDLSLDLAGGEIFGLLGPSGCGKSTLLRLVAGFEAPDAGTIAIDGADLTSHPPHRRPVNMMFQSYALFPHMSVERNVAYGLKGLGLGRAEIAARVAELLRLVRLQGFEARRPDTLSGGQRQRVALARALAREPKVLLLDEPLGALDRGLREETQGELRALQRRLGTSFVVVTHDPEEAMALSDRIGVMDRGKLVQVGPPRDLYERPLTRFVAGLLGDVNLIEGRLASWDDGPNGGRAHSPPACGEEAGGGGRADTAGRSPAVPPPPRTPPRKAEGTRFGTVETALGLIHARSYAADLPAQSVIVAIRPEQVRLTRGQGNENTLPGTLTDTAYLGDRVRHRIRMADGSELRVLASLPGGAESVAIGDTVRVTFPPDAALVLSS